MIESLYIGATGMHAQQTNLDVIANNLANVNTSGFKKNIINFEDLMYKTLATTNGIQGLIGQSQYIGVGSAVASTGKVFSQGEIKTTSNLFDVAIQGNGFFELQLPDNSLVYSRNGAFQLNSDGYLTNTDGYLLSSNIQIPRDSTDVTIQPDGKVFATVAGETNPIEIGTIELANFINPAALTPLGDNLYVPNIDTGQVFYSDPSQDGLGSLAQSFIEGSNVELVTELLNLILAQRAYEINSKVVQASDEMLSLANSLRR